MTDARTILTAKEMARTLERLASEIVERRGEEGPLVLVGIQRRGVDLARRLKKLLDARLPAPVILGQLDINLYRDDWSSLGITPAISHTEIPAEVEGASVILVDDVLYSGRTTRAALEAILDFGRPRRVELLVLIDRGHRELPIQADYVGKRVNTSASERVDVLVAERDEQDKVLLRPKAGA
ncbi:MAG TPA: bifunctional pyr operon transcriptional regulator/uracil phosphoribosyltransferase PyrR [Humidesulfovibrio sp.]|uniref:bifunctional pyr operon transcriptional regulator/uracil phosphoribosyltransferase PyrR n=1 Tax=Humidesulfovibrio sp. TaxID=2910988 RepID=UPI002B972EAE|nr:bifunctional pyr operon transcriptional regulator/uracil phosphoribosyltransferase PyrR [Humidesulfovibrio sp.]HWR03556.1 bifunctional pyr operon transcriptional regulator/uracil phosphoribosyltransferase PyrR [Humidesulfovibrio sp.]